VHDLPVHTFVDVLPASSLAAHELHLAVVCGQAAARTLSAAVDMAAQLKRAKRCSAG
jgi:hypothetical protein